MRVWKGENSDGTGDTEEESADRTAGSAVVGSPGAGRRPCPGEAGGCAAAGSAGADGAAGRSVRGQRDGLSGGGDEVTHGPRLCGRL